MATFKQFKAQDIIISPLEVNKGFRFVANSPTPTVSPTPSLTPSISATPSISITPSVSATPSISVTPSITVSISVSKTPSISRTPSITPSISLSGAPGQSPTPTPSISITPSISATPSISVTPTISVTPSATSNLFSETNYGYDNGNSQDACDDIGSNPAIYSNIEWLELSSPILYFNSTGTKRAAPGYYAIGSIVKYYGTSGTWGSSGEFCAG